MTTSLTLDMLFELQPALRRSYLAFQSSVNEDPSACVGSGASGVQVNVGALVGRDSGHPDKRVRSSEAYMLAAGQFLALLPDCHTGCECCIEDEIDPENEGTLSDLEFQC